MLQNVIRCVRRGALCTLPVAGQRGLGLRGLALRLEALSTQVQRLSGGRGGAARPGGDDLSRMLRR